MVRACESEGAWVAVGARARAGAGKILDVLPSAGRGWVIGKVLASAGGIVDDFPSSLGRALDDVSWGCYGAGCKESGGGDGRKLHFGSNFSMKLFCRVDCLTEDWRLKVEVEF